MFKVLLNSLGLQGKWLLVARVCKVTEEERGENIIALKLVSEQKSRGRRTSNPPQIIRKSEL